MDAQKHIVSTVLSLNLVFFHVAAVNIDYLKTYEFDVQPSQKRVFNRELVILLNKFETFEVNKIVFDDSEIDVLMENCYTEECESNKNNAIEKYNNKFDALTCANNFILAYIIHESIRLTQNDEQPLDKVKTLLNDFRTYVARMLSVLYYGRCIAPRSVVVVYIKLIAATDPTDVNGKFLKNSFLVYGSLKNDIANYSRKCEYHQLVSNQNWDIPEDKYVEIIKQLYDNKDLANAYNYEGMFTTENLSLSHVFEQHDVLFKDPDAVNFINWRKTQRLMDEYKNNLQNQFNSGHWPNAPFKHAVYHLWFQRVVYTTVLYYTWFHLKTIDHFETSKGGFCINCSKDKTNADRALIIKQLEEAMDILDIDDNVFSTILQSVRNTDDNINLVEQMAWKTLLISLIDIQVPITDIIQKAVGNQNYLNRQEITRNSDALKNYVSAVKKLLTPIGNNMFFIKCIYDDNFEKKLQSFLPYDISYNN